MHEVCPYPLPWIAAHERLLLAWGDAGGTGEPPPRPLVLSGWTYSNDVDKLERWNEMKRWAEERGFNELLHSQLAPGDFYRTDILFDGMVGPLGGPMLLPWNNEPRPVPPDELIRTALASLCENWTSVAGPELAAVTSPIRFTGRKKRRLLVEADFASRPPWGSWDRLGPEPGRKTFTDLRRAVNELISPHEVDHIDFTPALRP